MQREKVGREMYPTRIKDNSFNLDIFIKAIKPN